MAGSSPTLHLPRPLASSLWASLAPPWGTVKSIYLAIGSNIGNKKENIEKTKFKLIRNNVEILETSNYYESLSWPNQNNPKFLNIVLKIKTKLGPIELLRKCKDIEKEMGRKKAPKNSPRECDIDIIDYNYKKSENKILLPHPKMHTRNFVLIPLFEINKNWTTVFF